MVVENETHRYLYPAHSNPYEHLSVLSDHCYSRPWNWRPESTFLKPTKTLFMPQLSTRRKSLNPLTPLQDLEESIDIEYVEDELTPVYDVEKAKQLMEESELSISRIDDGDENWEETISRFNWTPTQNRLFNGISNVLNNDHLARLAQAGVHNEPVVRRTVIEKSVQRVRRLFATVFWETKLLQWLHQLLLDNLNKEYLASYLDILQTLKAKLPQFVDKIIQGQTIAKLGGFTNENMQQLLKRPWDPVISSLMQDKPKKLPGNPIILIVPSSPISNSRYLKWIHLLSNLATVINIPFNFGTPGNKTTITHCVDQMFASVRGKIQELKNDYPGRNIVLFGFNAGATMALQLAQSETVLCVVSLGFSLLTAEGKRGEPDDSLLELQCPALFVLGQCSNTSSQERMEDLRERMRVETGLIVVGSADDNLRISKKKKISEGITQSVVDRCIVDEIGEFISGIILSPFPPQIRQSPTHISPDPPLAKKTKLERKRYSSNASSLDSEEPPSPTPKISRPVGRPPGSRSKPKLETNWALQVAQAKMQAYGMAKHNVVSGSRLSTLLQGGIKTIPPKSPASTIKENVNLSTGATSKFIPNLGKNIDLSKITMISSSMKTGGNQLGNIVLLPDGKMKTIGGNILKGARYITSKKQLVGHRPPKPVKKLPCYIPTTSQSSLPPPANLTTQDIMDLPIIFADDNQIIEPSFSEVTQPPPVTELISITTTAPPPMTMPSNSKIITTSGNKFLLVNKAITLQTPTNFILPQSNLKQGALTSKQPKYTKIILSKRPPNEGGILKTATGSIISRIANLSPEISVKKISSIPQEHSSTLLLENIDLENELVATAVPKPYYGNAMKNITILPRKIADIMKSGDSHSQVLDSIIKEELGKRIASSIEDKSMMDDFSDPDYEPPSKMSRN